MNKKDSNKEENKTTNKPKDSVDSVLIPCEKQQMVAKHNENKGQNKGKNSYIGRAQTIFTGLIVLVTLAYTIFSALQWCEMQKTSNATKQAAEAGTRAVKVAERNIEATQKQFRLDQRAWINIKIGEFDKPLDAKKLPSYKFIANNSGKTPAYILSIHYKLWQKDIAGKIDMIADRVNNDETCFGPGETQYPLILLHIPFDQTLIDAIKTGEVIFFIGIEIIYFDIYQPKIKRHTRVCFYWNPTIKDFLYGDHCSYMD